MNKADKDKMLTDVSYKHDEVNMWLRQCWKEETRVVKQHPIAGKRWSVIPSPDGVGKLQMPTEIRNMYKQSYKTGRGRDWVYKTPAELQKERDEARNRMVEAAETFDEMNRRRGSHRLMKDQAKAMRNVGPAWYQELSTEQIEIVENLGEMLKSDMEEGHVQRTRVALAKLGLLPRPTEKQVLNAAAFSCTSPVIFLQKLSEVIRPKKRAHFGGKVPLYAVRERLVLSGLAHLTLPRTLTELHARLPHPPVPPTIRKKAKERPKRLVYASPYIGRQLILTRFKSRRRKVDRFEEKNQRMLKVVTLPVRSRMNFKKKKHGENLAFDEWFLRMPKRDRKSTFFRERLAKLRSHQTDTDTNDLQDEASHVSNTLRLVGENVRSSFISAPCSAIPEDFMRYATSSDPPDMSCAPSYPVLLAPANSLATAAPLVVPTTIQKGTASFMSVEQELPTAQVDPLVHPPTASLSLQLHLALMGYWDALPRTKYNFPFKNKFTPKEPSREMKMMVKLLLSQMAKEGNPLAALPQVHLLPHITKWMLRRDGYKLTKEKKMKLKGRCQFLTERIISRPRSVTLPMDYIPADRVNNLTWRDIDWFRKKARKIVDEYYGNMRRAMVDDGREFYAAMCMEYYDNKTFRDVFFAYLPSKEEHVYPRNKTPGSS